LEVGDSIRIAIDDFGRQEVQAAMLHACNAIDGTAAKRFPKEGSNARFTRLVRDSYGVFGPMAMPGIDLETTRWPVRVRKPKAQGGQPDLADVIYGVHRCCHGHGEALPDGFELISDVSGPRRLTHVFLEPAKVRLSDRTIFGLLAVAVLAPENVGQKVPDGHYLMFEDRVFPIADWWGRFTEFAAIVAQVQLPKVTMNFGEWMPQK
jgi:hypothetical protein